MVVFGRLVRTVLKPDKCRATADKWLSDTQLQRSLFLSFLKKRRGNECVVKSAGSRWIFFIIWSPGDLGSAMSQKSQTGGISFLGVVDVKRTKLLEKRTFGGFATQMLDFE